MTKSLVELEREFNEEVRRNYSKAREKGYPAQRYWQMLERNDFDAVKTARQLVGRETSGLERLKSMGCLDLSLEQSVLNHRELFEAKGLADLVEKAKSILDWLRGVSVADSEQKINAIKALRGCAKGTKLTEKLLESRKEDLELEEAKWRKR